MELNKEIISEILNINWFENCGNNEVLSIDENYSYIKNIDKISKNLDANRWENICLEACNMLTGYLAKNNPDIFNGYWNIAVRQIKNTVIPKIIDKLQTKVPISGLPQSSIEYVTMDIISMIMVLSYRSYYHSEFYEDMYIIYKNGHFPCGWLGKFPGGKFELY